MGALSELAAAGADFVPELGETVARHPFGGACDAIPWRVASYRRDRGVFRLHSPRWGVYVDAYPGELVRLGRPDALDTAAAVMPLHEWPRDDLRAFLEMPAGTPCAECGRPRMT